MVRVADLDDSMRFYRDLLGLVEVKRNDYEKGRFTLAYLAAPDDVDRANIEDAPLLELTHNWDSEEYDGGRNFGHLAYSVENIYETCEKLKNAGIIINRPPRDGYMAFIRSPDNISIELLQTGKPLAPQEPWVSMENTGEW